MLLKTAHKAVVLEKLSVARLKLLLLFFLYFYTMHPVYLILCFITMVELLSCNHKKMVQDPKINSSSNQVAPAGYTHIKYDFYRNAQQDIFEKKEALYEDSSGFHRIVFYDSLIQTGAEWGEKTPLKSVMDLESYTEAGTDGYFSKDKNKVYFTRGSSDGAVRLIIKEADPKTFIPLGNRWAKDKKHIFWGTETIPNADLKSFTVFGALKDSARDKKNNYYQGEIINETGKR